MSANLAGSRILCAPGAGAPGARPPGASPHAGVCQLPQQLLYAPAPRRQLRLHNGMEKGGTIPLPQLSSRKKNCYALVLNRLYCAAGLAPRAQLQRARAASRTRRACACCLTSAHLRGDSSRVVHLGQGAVGGWPSVRFGVMRCARRTAVGGRTRVGGRLPGGVPLHICPCC